MMEYGSDSDMAPHLSYPNESFINDILDLSGSNLIEQMSDIFVFLPGYLDHFETVFSFIASNDHEFFMHSPNSKSTRPKFLQRL